MNVAPTTDADLQAAWTRAKAVRGSTDPIMRRVAEMSDEWTRMQADDRAMHRLVALRLLQEIADP